MNLSLMSCQMMRVISSPSSSTTGFLTLILGIWEAMVRRCEIPAAIGREKVVGLAKERMGWRFAWAKRETKGRREDIMFFRLLRVMTLPGGVGVY